MAYISRASHLQSSTPPFLRISSLNHNILTTYHRQFTTTRKMATTSTPSPAPWRKDFTTHISSMPVPSFVLATSHNSSPRTRTCIYRGLWSSLPPNSHNPAPLNPPLFESDLPVFTTDVRMVKIADIRHNNQVEAVFWASDHGTQWRIRGEAFILVPDIDDDKELKTTLRNRMRPIQTGSDQKQWSFSREVTAHFGNLSPAMRGTFAHPPPGRFIADHPLPADGQLGLGKKVDDLEDPVARGNFRVVVIIPSEVDRTDLSDAEHPRRWLYVFRATGDGERMPGGEILGEWEVAEVWP